MTHKDLYVKAMRNLRDLSRNSGVLERWDSWAERSPRGLWLRSLLAIYDPEDLAALDLPWWNLRAAKEVADFLSGTPGACVFEWGSGASTIWLARRAAHVVSIEHDPEWAETMVSLLPGNADITICRPGETSMGSNFAPSSKRGFEGLDFSAYVSSIRRVPWPLDLVVVDGRAREACLMQAVDAVAADGFVVLDNVERSRYRKALDHVKHRTNVRWFYGATACLPYPTGTALIQVTDG